MDVRIFAALFFVGVLGSFAEARASFFGYPFENGGASASFAASPRLKREVDSNGETTTKPTTTSQATTPKSTDPTTTLPSTTTPPSTSPTTTPPTTTESTTTAPTTTTTATTITTTTEATSPTTTPTTTSATTPTTPATTTPEPSTTTPESTKPTSKPKKPSVDVLSRSNIDDEPEESTKKPGPSLKNDKTPGPYFGPGGPGTFGPGFNPYFGYPGFNSIPGPGSNYAWTGSNNGQGFASAGASAGSFAGGYPGYPTGGFPGAVSPSIGSRGGFQDNTPNQNTGYGYNGIDPLYNAGPGQFYFPGAQFPYNDPFDMFRQIQAQIEAQHQAIANSMASNRGRIFASNVPNYAYTYASANMNNMGLPSKIGGGLFDAGVGNSNMELHNRLANEASYGGGSYGGGVPQVASASIGLGPGGGYQMGQISPAAPGIQSRFSEDLPAPSGNSFGVFSSSSSSSMTGPDGKQVNHKSSVTGVNDNGKVSFREVHD